jgi:hypothetical protein
VTDKPTIFISHSTSKLRATDDSVRVKEALRRALEARGWRVFLDSHSITGADLWRTEILHSLATAKAGIVLLNDQASNSEWVKAETLIMCFRKSIEPTFPLLPIVLPGANIEATFLKSYEPFEFNEIQRSTASFISGESVEAFVQTVADNKNLEQARQSSPTGVTWVQRVADILSGVQHDALGRAARRIMLEIEPGLITPTNRDEFCLRLRWALANLMHHKEAPVCLDALSELMGVLAIEKVKRFKQHLMSKWVENESAELLFLAIREPEKQGLLALNTSRQNVVDRYIERLRTEMPQDGPRFWVFSVAQPNGDCDEAVLLQKVEDAIRQSPLGSPLYDDARNPLSLEAVVSSRLEPKKFALGVLPMQYSDKSLLRKLRAQFPRIIFIVLSGDSGEHTSDCLAAGGRTLKPQLTPQKLNELSNLTADWEALFDLHFHEESLV